MNSDKGHTDRAWDMESSYIIIVKEAFDFAL
jgi:hypothetical protein